MPSSAAAPVPRPVADRAVLRRGLRVIGGGMARQRGPTAVAVVGAVLWAGATVATAWAIGWLTDEVVEPSVRAQRVEAAGLWTIFGVLLAVLVVKPITYGLLFRSFGETKLLAGEAGIRLGQMSEFSLLIVAVAVQTSAISTQAATLVQVATLITFVLSSAFVVVRYPTPIALSERLRRD